MPQGIDPALLMFAGRFLAQGGGNPGNGFGNALGAGLEAAGSTQLFRQEQQRTRQQDLVKAAESSIAMRKAMQELQMAEKQRTDQQTFIDSLPEDQRAAAAINPEVAASAEIKQANPDPLTAFQQASLARNDRDFAAGQEQLDVENLRADKKFDLEVQKLNAKSTLSVKDTASLRKEYTASSKSFNTVRDYYMRMQEAEDTGAGDIALVFAYMKTLDPDSAVRETEFANAENTAGVPEKIRTIYNRAMNGERLAPKQRQNFLNQADGLYDAQHQTQMRQKASYGEIASRAGADPRDILNQVYAPSLNDIKAQRFDSRLSKLGVDLSTIDGISQETGVPIEMLVKAMEAKRANPL